MTVLKSFNSRANSDLLSSAFLNAWLIIACSPVFDGIAYLFITALDQRKGVIRLQKSVAIPQVVHY